MSRDETFEKEILSNPRLLRIGVGYAESTIGARWPEWEKVVLQADPIPPMLPGAIVGYCTDVVGGRWLEVEPMLLESVKLTDGDEEAAVDYAVEVIKGRWPELEQKIIGGRCNPIVGVHYAHRVLERRWPELEQALLSVYLLDEFLYDSLIEYSLQMVRGPWAKAEQVILSQPPDSEKALAVVRYARDVVGGRWEPGEETLTACNYSMLLYAEDVMKGRLPAHLHNRMVLGEKDDSVAEYIAKYGV